MYNSRACAHKATARCNRPPRVDESAIGIAQGKACCHPTSAMPQPRPHAPVSPVYFPIIMAHRLLPHASVSLVFPVNLVSPRWLGACCMRQWARRFSDWKHPSVTLTPAQSLSAYWAGAHCPL